MARPKKEGMDYFPHDTDAANDEKIEALRMLYGNDGYAFYFILLERIYRTPSFELDISDAETIQILSKKVDVTTEKFNNMLETALKRGCFDRQAYEERKVLTSEGVKNRASVVVDKRKKMRQKYSETKGAIDKNIVSDAETNQKNGNNEEESTQSKVKKSKEKDSKEKKNKYAEYVSLTEAEYQKLVSEHGEEMTKRMIETLDNYKGANGKRYKSDYRAILNWVVDRVKRENSRTINNNPRYERKDELPDYIIQQAERQKRMQTAKEERKDENKEERVRRVKEMLSKEG